MNVDLLDRLRDDLDAADYRAATVLEVLGASADAARHRGVFAPARRAVAGRAQHASAALIRCFLLGAAIGAAELDVALPRLRAAGAEALGLVSRVEAARERGASASAFRAALSLNPVTVDDAHTAEPLDWWIISDLDDQLRRGPARADHVMGVGGATRSLIAQAPPGDIERGLDLGTGCGIVALHLAMRGSVVATDISERALVFARANARLNGLDSRIEFRHGDLFEPVAGERFDLVLSNPPFVITPRVDDAPVYEYRDGGRTGDDLAAAVIASAPEHLARGGTLICLANWESPWGENGLERVRGWIASAAERTGELAAWVIERDRVEPAQYAETWARDGGARPGTEEFDALVESWLQDFTARRIVAIGLGAIRVRRSSPSVIHIEQATGAYAPGRVGESMQEAFDAGVTAEGMSDAQVLDTHWLLADAVGEIREHTPGVEDPHSIVLTVDRPIARRVAADPLLAAAVGACDGDLTLEQIAGALATLLDVDASAASEALIAGVRELAWLGMLRPAQGSGA